MPDEAVSEFLAVADVLGVSPGSSRDAVRKRYYDLAMQLHPDMSGGAEGGAASHEAFVELHAAFEQLMRETPTAAASQAAPTAASTAARGGGAGPWARQSAASAKPFEPRRATLAEVLVRRLDDEPASLDEVWAELAARRLPISPSAADSLFRACSRARGAGGMAAALHLLREADALGTLDSRPSALCSLLSWCKEDDLDATFDVCNEVREEDKTPEVLHALSATFTYYSGVGGSIVLRK
ncbi:hypothetical protein EMIHUDRAFT_450269 [Emiliania huxleyi CCMP1516]|uniref:J domain-containing protein n=2 Tax=Emiliania huxleyi TaxID=2903 RepID=A0A0D3JSC4_EMIH1|nr:hypothetical protein EMIHUDRAFT_450269 [Emiliania huxleyi CCMP1516]EOD26409.1 hypothetical protein EMIHUDRAFT_450269 [Emiliania huxleyi CCMP1516]|eukprot:XP_005778838.1 hypothetical protein EMIHUDRAFT_450269 [Emiliania huxleyi CCMP1516]